jgi:hypothetical protein
MNSAGVQQIGGPGIEGLGVRSIRAKFVLAVEHQDVVAGNDVLEEKSLLSGILPPPRVLRITMRRK